MTKAEKVAVKIYPHGVFQGEEGDSLRAACMLGYGQAEKDLALTWEDIKLITTIADDMLTGTAWDAIDWPDEQKYYEEVLRRYQELKAEKK